MRILDGMSISNQDKKPTLFGIYSHFERSEKFPLIAEREISPKGRNDKEGVGVTEGKTWIPD